MTMQVLEEVVKNGCSHPHWLDTKIGAKPWQTTTTATPHLILGVPLIHRCLRIDVCSFNFPLTLMYRRK